jgi:RNA polymerase sporulation-specific sigma factor
MMRRGGGRLLGETFDDNRSTRLSPEREAHLWIRCHKDDEAREELIISYRPLVFWLAQKFQVVPSSYPDLVQEGMLALIKAVDNFEPERQLKFTTYAFYRIKGQMVNFLQRSEAKAPVPVDVEEELVAMDSFSPDLYDLSLTLSHEVKKLPQREAEIVADMFFKGHDAKEVAQEHHIDVSHVYRLKRNALARLRSWLLPDHATKEI